MDPKSSITPFAPGAGRLMRTNDGAHPPEFWAQVTAEHIFQMSPDMTGKRRALALAVQMKIADALEPHHGKAQADEKGKLGADTNHIMVPPDAESYLDEAMAAIQEAVKGSEWEAQYQRPDVIAVVRQEIAVHFRTAQHIEKSWAADRNKTHPAAQAFRAQHHPEA